MFNIYFNFVVLFFWHCSVSIIFIQHQSKTKIDTMLALKRIQNIHSIIIDECTIKLRSNHLHVFSRFRLRISVVICHLLSTIRFYCNPSTMSVLNWMCLQQPLENKLGNMQMSFHNRNLDVSFRSRTFNICIEFKTGSV